MKRRILFLDDDLARHARFRDRMAEHDVVYVETPEDAIRELEAGYFDLVSLDHDLFGKVYQPSDEKSGYVVAKHIADKMDKDIPLVTYCHSWNEKGVKKMMEALKTDRWYTTNAYALPFDSEEYWERLSPLWKTATV